MKYGDYYWTLGDTDVTIEDFIEYIEATDRQDEYDYERLKKEGTYQDIPDFMYENASEMEWEDTQYNVNEMLKALRAERKYTMRIEATGLDWMGNSGYKEVSIEDMDASDFVRTVRGGDYDARMHSYKATRNGFSMIVSSHDVPMGGIRKVTFKK